MNEKWIGIACAIAVSMFSSYNSAADGCLLTKESFIQQFCGDIYNNAASCYLNAALQPSSFVQWKVLFIAFKTVGEVYIIFYFYLSFL